MDRVPLEVIIRHACHKIGDYFAEQAEKERKNGKVAILVEDFTNSLFYMPCDEHGYPNFHHFNYMTFDSLSMIAIQNQEMPSTPMTIKEVSIMIDRPMLTQRMDWQERPYVFMWSGKKMTTREIPLEKLNVSELMKLAQEVVKSREGLVIDEAMKNKIYK
jgi:hypothetical protein